jgi:large subunit ribosomal protein L13
MSVATEVLYVDASDQILGRLASNVAKLLLNGYKVIVFNAEKAAISGNKARIVEKFRERYARRTLKNPEKLGHREPKTPHGIVRRAIRGMLPHKKPRGREAFKRLLVYSGVPSLPANAKIIKFEDASVSKLGRGYVYLGEIAKIFGWKG